MAKQSCGKVPKFPVNSALRTTSTEVEVPDSAIFKCREDGKITDLGREIHIQCMIEPGTTNASFIYPEGWGAENSKCRDPIVCMSPFDAPLETGLQLHLKNGSYYEYEHAIFK